MCPLPHRTNIFLVSFEILVKSYAVVVCCSAERKKTCSVDGLVHLHLSSVGIKLSTSIFVLQSTEVLQRRQEMMLFLLKITNKLFSNIHCRLYLNEKYYKRVFENRLLFTDSRNICLFKLIRQIHKISNQKYEEPFWYANEEHFSRAFGTKF